MSYTTIGKDINNHNYKQIGYSTIEPNSNSYAKTFFTDDYKDSLSSHVFDPFILTNIPDMAFVIQFKDGLGLSKYGYQMGEITMDSTLVGYIKNGVQYGAIIPDSELTVGISNHTLESRTKVYPTITDNEIYIETSAQKYTVEVVDFNNCKLKSIEVNGESVSTISVSNLPSGIYLLNIITTDSQITKKIIKR